jgi:hypothetical protein
MNFIKYMCLISAVCSINFIDTRTRGSAQQPTQPQPVQPRPIPAQRSPQAPVQQPPLAQPSQSYRNLSTYIKRNAQNVWDNRNGILRSEFVNSIVQQARASQLNDFQLEALLQTARDIHGVFSGNQARDISILQAVNNQIATALQ